VVTVVPFFFSLSLSLTLRYNAITALPFGICYFLSGFALRCDTHSLSLSPLERDKRWLRAPPTGKQRKGKIGKSSFIFQTISPFLYIN